MDAFFFGYGSLVNRATHDYRDAQPATIRGWRREWCRSRAFDRTFLSVVPDPQAQIDGLIARVPGGDWAALDLRETGYARHELHPDQIVAAPPVAAQIYAVAAQDAAPASPAHPIYLSYLDVVVAGFLTEFGPEGVARFFATTTRWTAALDDRSTPRYPRAQQVGKVVQGLVDGFMDMKGLARLAD